MIVNTKNFPQITLSKNINNQGTNYQRVILQHSFRITNKINSFFISQKENIKNILNRKTRTSKNNGYLLEIIFHGLNYNAKRIHRERPAYLLDLHKSEISICNESIAKTYRSRIHKRRLLFFSYDKELIYNIGKIIKKLKLPNPYTGKGLFSREDSYTVKKGKKR